VLGFSVPVGLIFLKLNAIIFFHDIPRGKTINNDESHFESSKLNIESKRRDFDIRERTLRSIGCARYSSVGYGLNSLHSSIPGWNNSEGAGCYSAIKTLSLPHYAVFITGV
jgi:hypothetical protein